MRIKLKGMNRFSTLMFQQEGCYGLFGRGAEASNKR
jgi:hypothetical protein